MASDDLGEESYDGLFSEFVRVIEEVHSTTIPLTRRADRAIEDVVTRRFQQRKYRLRSCYNSPYL
jgi:hypothetical protein